MFLDLEAQHGLNVGDPIHKWLLRHLYLDLLNDDALLWARSWNHHKIQRRGARERAPLDMFLFGMIENGARGLDIPQEENIENLDEYGIDWENLDNEGLVQRVHNIPRIMNEVACPEPFCPFTEDVVHLLDDGIARRVAEVRPIDMPSRRQLWMAALEALGEEEVMIE